MEEQINWDKIRNEYIEGHISYSALSAKYGISRRTIADRGKAGKWVELRGQVRAKTVTKSVEAIAKNNADVGSSIHDAAMSLLDAFKYSLERQDSLSATQLKDYGAALKSIQAVLTNGPTELDIREQEARIANLRRQADSSGGADTAKLIVEGLPEEFTV